MTVLAAVMTAEEAGPLVRWGLRLARSRGEGLVVLHATRAAQPQEAKDLAREDPDDDHSVRRAIRTAAAEALLGPAAEAAEGAAADGAAADGDAAGNGASAGADPSAAAAGGAVAPPTDAAEGSEVAEGGAAPSLRLRGVGHPRPVEAVLAEVASQGATLLIAGKHQAVRGDDGELDPSLQLVDRAPCATMLLRASGVSGQRCERILVPAAGGPHAKVALQLAAALAESEGAHVTPLYVEPSSMGEDAREVGVRRLNASLKDAGVSAGARVAPRVVVGDSAVAAIAEIAAEGYDLVLVGASDRGITQRVLFGTVPDKLLSGPDALAVAVVRRARPLAERFREVVSARLAEVVPPLEREARLALFERLQVGSRTSVDFMAMICLSTAIAALGLIQDSAAVVIGAMLVAPLMTPMIGAGLALIQGNVPMVRDAARTIGFGFLTALGIGLFFGFVWHAMAPAGKLTPQLLARGSPNVLDLFVAFLSGLAAAYALARPGLMGAMAGVAIAAALVPPIGTAGIALAMGDYPIGRGAALLFGTNLVAIVVGAAAAFRLLGVHPTGKSTAGRLWARRALLGLILLTVVLAFPLASVLISSVGRQTAALTLTPELRTELEQVVAEAGLSLVALDRPAGPEGDLLEVVVAGAEPPPAALASRLAALATEELRRPVRVRLVGLRSAWSSLSGEGQPR